LIATYQEGASLDLFIRFVVEEAVTVKWIE
jgi:hypothetical protein